MRKLIASNDSSKSGCGIVESIMNGSAGGVIEAVLNPSFFTGTIDGLRIGIVFM